MNPVAKVLILTKEQEAAIANELSLTIISRVTLLNQYPIDINK